MLQSLGFVFAIFALSILSDLILTSFDNDIYYTQIRANSTGTIVSPKSLIKLSSLKLSTVLCNGLMIDDFANPSDGRVKIVNSGKYVATIISQRPSVFKVLTLILKLVAVFVCYYQFLYKYFDCLMGDILSTKVNNTN